MKNEKQENHEISRVSKYFGLDYSQGELPFVDVDVYGDTSLFLDPRAIRLLNSPWGNRCVFLLQHFFQNVLDAIHSNDHKKALRFLGALHEPNETHLGLSTNRAQGRAMGSGLSKDVWKSLSESEAAKSSLLVDLEDTALLVDGIDVDIISDITTNVIREQLIDFTQCVCEDFEIPLTKGIDSGPLWDPEKSTWTSRFESLPMTDEGKLLLVPKEIVRKKVTYSSREYFQNYVLSYLQELELNAGTKLVQLLKNGNRRVTKKSLKEKYGDKKIDALRITKEHPEILDNYRDAKRRRPAPVLQHEDFQFEVEINEPRWDKLISDVVNILPGNAGADGYHKAIERLLTPLFYPNLTDPDKEAKLHAGRKRIDIKYSNMGHSGFFKWLASSYPAPHIFIECKNYSDDIKNPELDQLSSRFSPSRGQVGFLLCRRFADKDLFIQRCKDTAKDSRGFIIVLDDSDVRELVKLRKENNSRLISTFLKKRFNELIM